LATCPVEMNLMPDSTLRWQSFNRKKPYLVAAVISLVLVAFGVGFLFQKLALNKESEIDRLNPVVAELNSKVEKFGSAYKRLQKSQAEAAQIMGWMQERYYWGDFLGEMRKALIRSEDAIRKKISAQKPGADAGIWIEQMTAAPSMGSATTASAAPQPVPAMDPGMQMDVPAPVKNAAATPITIVCRAVSLKILADASANNKDIAYIVRDEIAASPLVNPDVKMTQLADVISADDANGTFTFTVNVMPLKPLKF